MKVVQRMECSFFMVVPAYFGLGLLLIGLWVYFHLVVELLRLFVLQLELLK